MSTRLTTVSRIRALRGFALRAAGTLVMAWALAGWAGGVATAAPTRARFDTRVLARIPSPGFAALSLITPNHEIYAGTFENPAGDSVASRLFRFGADGGLQASLTPAQQDLSQPHGLQAAAQDAQGRLYLMQESPPAVLRFDPATGHSDVYARFRQLPTCATATASTECKQTVADNAPEPDYAAWGPDASMYVTDFQQGLIWRVPPGGGTAHVWFTDPRLDGVMFDAAGIVLEPDHRSLLFDTSASAPSTGPNFADGKLYRLPINPDGRPGALSQIWESQPREAPDGFAVAQSGNVYIALVGPGVNQLVEVSPRGQEVTRYPDALTNQSLPVPFDEPSSVQFDGERMIVTNLSYFAGDASHQVLFDVFAGEPGRAVYQPPAPMTAGPGPTRSLPTLSLRISLHPRVMRVGRAVLLRVRVSAGVGARQRGVPGALVSVGRRRARSQGGGVVTLRIRPHHPGRLRVRVSLRGYRSARTYVRVRRG